MSTKTTHDVYHPTRSPAPGTAWGRMCSPFIAIYSMRLPQPLPPAMKIVIMNLNNAWSVIHEYE